LQYVTVEPTAAITNATYILVVRTTWGMSGTSIVS
jgi:hypothetical protein